jgi:pimeloyl-ACP methyl ester carboxylesterase
MAEHLQLKYPFKERPRSDWGSIATELLGAETKFIQGARWTHRVVEKGDPKAPPLFMYHGIGGHVEPYARTLPQLAKHFRVFAVDALYHGYSSKEPWEGENRVVRQAEAYVDLINALGYEKAHYEGESMGAFIGFEIGMRFPQTVDKLILNGMGIIETVRKDFKTQPHKGDLFDLSKKAVLDPSYENVRNRLLWLVHDDAAVNDEMIAIRQRLYQDPQVNAAMRRVFGIDGGRLQANHDAPYTEEQIKAQWTHKDTMVIYGEFNPGRGPDYGEYCADLIGAKFYEFKGAGHWPMWETPDEYVAVLRTFLES